jgi:hypothetical protein
VIFQDAKRAVLTAPEVAALFGRPDHQMTCAGVEEGSPPGVSPVLDRTFKVGLVVKAADGVLEIVAGKVLLFISPSTIERPAHTVTAHELGEDPRSARELHPAHDSASGQRHDLVRRHLPAQPRHLEGDPRRTGAAEQAVGLPLADGPLGCSSATSCTSWSSTVAARSNELTDEQRARLRALADTPKQSKEDR